MPVEIEAGKLGRQIDSRGVVKEFTPEFFQEVIESYDPNNFKAPAIISHDTKGIPDDKLHANKELSYGVASGLKMVGDRLKISFDKLSPKIKEHFDNGELVSVSPSFYPPTHHANPTPGKWSLRHLSFLGANPPAIKGLAAPTFSETGYNPAEHTLDFSFPGELKETGEVLEFSIFSVRSLFSSLRDWLIEKHGKEEAEKIIPGHSIENMVMDDRFQQAAAFEYEASYSKRAADELNQLRRRVDELENIAQPREEKAIPVASLYQESDNTNKSKNMKTKAKKDSAPPVDPDLEMEDIEDEEEEDEQEETPPTKKKKKTMDLNEDTIDYAAELAEERRARKLLEFQVQNEQRKAEKERSDRKFDKITNFCESLVREGQLAASQVGDRLLEFGEGEETQQSLPEFLMSLDEQQLSFMEDYLSSQPKIIDYGEFAKDNDDSAAHRAIDFNAVPGANISDESRDEFEEILHYCEQHSLDPNDDDDFNQAAKAVLR